MANNMASLADRQMNAQAAALESAAKQNIATENVKAALKKKAAMAPAAPAAPSGNYNEKSNQNTTDNQNKVVNKVDSFTKPEDLDAVIEGIRATKAYQEQAGSIQRMRDFQIAMAESAPAPQADLSPLYDFANYLTKGKFNAKYTPKKDNTRETLLKYGQEIADKEQELNKLPFDVLGKLKTNSEQTTILEALKGVTASKSGMKPVSAGMSGANMGVRPSEVARSANNLSKEFDELNADFNVIESALNLGTLGALNTAVYKSARALLSEKGPLSKGDVSSVIAKTLGLQMAEVEAYLSNNPDVKVPPALIASLRERLNIGRKATIDRYKSMLASQKSVYDSLPRQQGFDSAPAFGAFENQLSAEEAKHVAPPAPPRESLTDLFKRFKQSAQ